MGMITWSMCLCLCVCMCVCVCRCLELEVSRGRQRGEKVSSVVFAGRSVWIVPHITPPSRAFARLSSVHSSRRDPCFGGFCFSDLPAPDRGLSRTSRAALISLAGHVQSMDIFGRAHRAATIRYTVPKPGGRATTLAAAAAAEAQASINGQEQSQGRQAAVTTFRQQT